MGDRIRAFCLSTCHSSLITIIYGWGGRIRTYECRIQRPVPYHLATPQYQVSDLERDHYSERDKGDPLRPSACQYSRSDTVTAGKTRQLGSALISLRARSCSCMVYNIH